MAVVVPDGACTPFIPLAYRTRFTRAGVGRKMAVLVNGATKGLGSGGESLDYGHLISTRVP